ncbi:GDYXXLXY domain-containing protein [Methanolobus mangrovi]|uniref:GDYXXLXY domain-containing protein n=1 Tax=Methanolobus mangrovi TaxID=3072977 RepID=A0AA51UE36_9EURY|nr:GDYXXLXY domain-containing protein [Methanolobus mangrovi]WMW21471.1 GDYXXLXY domain-containing protein [Methanolobus mangrovi]
MKQKQFLLLMAYSLIVISLIFLPKYVTLNQGKEIVLKTEPVDPRDVFRGDYVILNYEISSVNLNETPYDYEFMDGESIYAVLSEKTTYWGIDSISHAKPAIGDKDVCMKGTVTRNTGDAIMIEWGIESYFVPEGEGWQIQEQMDNISVIVSVDTDCSAVVKQLLLNGEPVEFE